MIGNINGIVESYYAADTAKSKQNASNGAAKGFSDYLDYALLMNRGNGLFSDGLGIGSSYSNALSGNFFQSLALKALKESLKKESSGSENDAEEESETNEDVNGKKAEWARIRVIHHYKSPLLEEELAGQVDRQL